MEDDGADNDLNCLGFEQDVSEENFYYYCHIIIIIIILHIPIPVPPPSPLPALPTFPIPHPPLLLSDGKAPPLGSQQILSHCHIEAGPRPSSRGEEF